MAATFDGVSATGNRAHGDNYFVAANYTGVLGATLRNSMIGTQGVPGSGAQLGFGVRLQNEGAPTSASARLLVTGSTVQETASFNLVNVNQGIVGQGSSTPSLVTVTNNILRNSGARAVTVQQNNNTDADSAGLTCVNIAANTTSAITGQAGDGTVIRLRRLDANAGAAPFQVVQASQADLAAQNSIAAVQVSVSGTPSYGAPACTLP